MNDQRNAAWWLGASHLLANGLAHGAQKAQRVHLAIADESFGVLARIPVTRPVSEPVRMLHHGIARLCYGSVAVAARTLAELGHPANHSGADQHLPNGQSAPPAGSTSRSADCGGTPPV